MAAAASSARRSAPPRTKVSARAARVASSAGDHWAATSGRAELATSTPFGATGSFRPPRPIFAVAQRVVGLDEGVELARPLVDHRGLRVAEVTLDRELVAVAVRAV